MAIVRCREIGVARPKSARSRQRTTLEIDAVHDTPQAEVVVETLADDFGDRTALTLREFLGGRGLFLGQLNLGSNHADMITVSAIMPSRPNPLAYNAEAIQQPPTTRLPS